MYSKDEFKKVYKHLNDLHFDYYSIKPYNEIQEIFFNDMNKSYGFATSCVIAIVIVGILIIGVSGKLFYDSLVLLSFTCVMLLFCLWDFALTWREYVSWKLSLNKDYQESESKIVLKAIDHDHGMKIVKELIEKNPKTMELLSK